MCQEAGCKEKAFEEANTFIDSLEVHAYAITDSGLVKLFENTINANKQGVDKMRVSVGNVEHLNSQQKPLPLAVSKPSTNLTVIQRQNKIQNTLYKAELSLGSQQKVTVTEQVQVLSGE